MSNLTDKSMGHLLYLPKQYLTVRLASIAVGVHWSFSFSFEDLNNSQVFRVFASKELQNIAHKFSYDLCMQSPHLPLSSNCS
jgi:hypothetical protein